MTVKDISDVRLGLSTIFEYHCAQRRRFPCRCPLAERECGNREPTAHRYVVLARATFSRFTKLLFWNAYDQTHPCRWCPRGGGAGTTTSAAGGMEAAPRHFGPVHRIERPLRS